jgi:hypothetical protein
LQNVNFLSELLTLEFSLEIDFLVRLFLENSQLPLSRAIQSNSVFGVAFSFTKRHASHE